jgi:hypothetical protein
MAAILGKNLLHSARKNEHLSPGWQRMGSRRWISAKVLRSKASGSFRISSARSPTGPSPGNPPVQDEIPESAPGILY